MNIHICSPIQYDELKRLRAGDSVLLSGTIYTARDAAHALLVQALERGEKPLVELRGQTVFYAGPTPPPPGKPTGSIGPTTSCRMDSFTPALLKHGVRAMIGKGDRSKAVIEAIRDTGSVYFTAIGGCAAYMASCVISCEVAAYDFLGTESIKRLTVRDMPLTVAIDFLGNDAYTLGLMSYREYINKVE